MRSGFILGKFMPLHKGHLALVDFAKQHCDLLYIILCASNTETINIETRKGWLETELKGNSSVNILCFAYDENEFPNTSVSSREVSAKWAIALKQLVPDAAVVFTSERYGDYLAEYMHIEHIPFDVKRTAAPVSASAILKDPFKNWDLIAGAAKHWFVKKIVLLGSESTGKSVLTEKLATFFNTTYVPEAAREIIEKTDECIYDDLQKIAALHAKRINENLLRANKLLFIDTDIHITRSYSRFLFDRELVVDPWIDEANRADLYIFLETDAPFVQDGTRLDKEQRDKLSRSHKETLRHYNIPFVSINGNWEERFNLAVRIVEERYFDKHA
jgi:HTH-type transcriptional regulator, transcriptional repressor of NAD biosynthesis genes